MRPTILAAALLVATAVGAQSTTGAPQSRVPTAADSALQRALDLPRVLQRARDAGIPDGTIQGVLDELRRRGIPADEAVPAVAMEVDAVEAGAPKDNFGSFVRAQVESGLRGRELAAAIHAERARRGMGPAGSRGGRPEGAGARPESRGGRPDGAGARPERGGRPEAAGTRRQTPDSADKAPTRGGKRP